MDAEKSLKIAARRFQNGNYLLSLKRYNQARKEFDVALTLYEKSEAYKELAEALNNVGITLLKDGMADVARGYFERSYAIKKQRSTATKESMFNTLYNLLSVSDVLSPEEFETYFLEMKSLGELLGGDYLAIVEREKAVYEGMVAQRIAVAQQKHAEALARSSPSGALEHLVTAGLPCVVKVDFVLHGFAINLTEPITFMHLRKAVKIGHLASACGITGTISVGTMEFEAAHDSVKSLMDGQSSGAEMAALISESYDHVRKLMDALVQAREDITFSLSKDKFSVTGIHMKNAFGELMEIHSDDTMLHVEPVMLSSEDAMMLNVMLSSEPTAYKLLLLNARRLADEENFALSVVESVTGMDAFLNVLLRSSLNGDHLLDYTSIQDCCLYDRIAYLKKLIVGLNGGNSDGPLEQYLGESGRDIDDAVGYYDRIMAGEQMAISTAEAERVLKGVNRTVYDLKSKYGI